MNTPPLSPIAEKLITEFTSPYVQTYECADYARWQAMDMAIKHCRLLLQQPVVQQCIDENSKWQAVEDELTGAAIALKNQLQQAEIKQHQNQFTVTCFDADSLAELLNADDNPERKQWRAELHQVQQQLRHGRLSEAEYNLLFCHWMDLMVVLYDIPAHHSFYAQVELYQTQRNQLIDDAFSLLAPMRSHRLTDMEMMQQIEDFTTLIDKLGAFDYQFLCCYNPAHDEPLKGGEALVLCEAVVPGER